jgi:site-specific DNA-methyltransferase (adenine-specific)
LVNIVEKKRAPLNRTITLSDEDRKLFIPKLKHVYNPVKLQDIENSTIHQDLYDVLHYLPEAFVDLLFIDPPYNLSKSFNGVDFKQMPIAEYVQWIETWLSKLIRILTADASIYICGDWQSSAAIFQVAERYFKVRNRITWEREKGRGAKHNWKNCAEDIIFCTMSDKYTLNLDKVMLKRRVLAPYTHSNGEPKDWQRTDMGGFRLTHPSNIWTDITIPYWSMLENTDHPTQKPEKLLAKIILASSNENDLVFDPFLGSGTTSVVAKKLKRRYVGIEVDETYCCIAEKRLKMAESDTRIQGYEGGVFWERNTLAQQRLVQQRLVQQPKLL